MWSNARLYSEGAATDVRILFKSDFTGRYETWHDGKLNEVITFRWSPPAACPFQPRCRYEVGESREHVPPLVEIEAGHRVACFNPVPADEWDRAREAATA